MFAHDLFPTDGEATIFAPAATNVTATHGNADSRLSVDFYEPSQVIDNQRRGPYPAATFETAFDSQNNMAVGFNMYVGGRFVAVYDDPLQPGAEPAAYLNDLGSMPISVTFDRHDNLYIGDHNRARVLMYRNPMNNPPRRSEQLDESELPAPLPEYSTNIRAISPPPPYCVLRSPDQSSDGTLTVIVDNFPTSRGLNLQVRKIASSALHNVPINGPDARVEGNAILVSQAWTHLWRDYEKTAASVRLLREGQPLTGWSPSFIIADDVEACGQARPAPTPPSTRMPLPTATLSSVSTSEPTPTPDTELPTVTAISSETPDVPTPTMAALSTATTPLPTATSVGRVALPPTAVPPPTTNTPARPEPVDGRPSIPVIAVLVLAGLALLGLGFAAGRMLLR